MNVLFICSCLEQNKDGVGDYTRLLAAELIRTGNNVSIIAIHDKYVKEHTHCLGKQSANGVEVATLRISSQHKRLEKISLCQHFISDFQPHFLGLQYVPYGFQKKGLPFYLASELKKIGQGKNWHIMFHELWVGISNISPLKHKITGFFQKRITRNLVGALRPKLITTSNLLYQTLLKKAAIQSGLLSLFSNIPIEPKDKLFTEEIYRKLQINIEERNHWRITGIFGNLYPSANLAVAVEEEYKAALTEGKELAFIAFGRISEDGMAEFNRLKDLFLTKVKFFYMGEQTAPHVSQLFQLMDSGISCTPAQHIGKSGVYAAMRLHDLKILLPAYSYLPEYDAVVKQSLADIEKRTAQEWSVAFIARELISLLSKN